MQEVGVSSYQFNQIPLISAITKELDRQHPGLPADDRFNAIIRAATLICEEFAREPVKATKGMGLVAWLESDDVGLSSRFMASVLSNGKISTPFNAPNHYPRDPDDLGRCIRLIEAVPDFEGLVYLLYGHGHEWDAVAKNWERWKLLYAAGDESELYSEMQKVYARGPE